jgi:hypothetical protein
MDNCVDAEHTRMISVPMLWNWHLPRLSTKH